MTPMDPLDVDPFAFPSRTARIEYLFHLRRATHRFLVRHATTLWTRVQQSGGQLDVVPPTVAALPARQQPKALAADEAARFTHAHLYGLDEAATTAAVTLGAAMVDYTPNGVAPGTHRAWTPVATPPARTGLLRWASGIGYDSVGIPLIACHWGPIPQGTWLAWWPDHRLTVCNDITQFGITRQKAKLLLQEFGPLGYPEVATTITLQPDANPDTAPNAHPDTNTPAELQEDAYLLALTSTVLASWALLTTPGAAHLIKRHPTAAQAARDRRAGLQPRPATLATRPIDTGIIERLGNEGQP